MHNKELVRIFTQSLTAIINKYIKTTSNQFIEIYEKLFNLIFDTGFIPESWVAGNIILIYKNIGDSNDPKNFRNYNSVGSSYHHSEKVYLFHKNSTEHHLKF
jgi:hypothetical protein